VTANVDASIPAAGEPLCVTCAGAGGDTDGDEVCDPVDNCPDDPNPSQLDSDGDGEGDACDVCPFDEDNDIDADTVCGDVDNCPDDWNPGQEDLDNDDLGDTCDDADVAGLSLRKLRTKDDGTPARASYAVMAELDATPTTDFPSKVDTDGVAVIIETSTPPAELNTFTFSGNDCSLFGSNIKCREPLTRSVLRLKSRSATLFYKVYVSVKRITLTHQPTAAETPLVVRLQTADLIDRRDDIDNCADRAAGKIVLCRDLP